MGAVEDMVPKMALPTWEGLPDACSNASSNASAATASILENVITVSREFLNDGVPSSPGTVRSLRVVEVHLTAIVHNSRSEGSPLLEKEAIPPNQRTWTETAAQMGAMR